MSIFLDFLTDEDGKTHEYGHCYQDYDDKSETGCGMEYAYYADDQRLDHWHDAVGLVTRVWNFTPEQREALDREHDACHVATCQPAHPTRDDLLVADSWFLSGELSEMVCPEHLPDDAIVDADLASPEFRDLSFDHPVRFWASLAQYSDTSSDTPNHCAHPDCWRLLPQSLTPDGENYVRERHGDSPSTITAYWMEHFELEPDEEEI